MSNHNTGLAVTTEWTIKAVPREGMTLDELEAKLRAIGNKIVRREADGIVMVQTKETQILGVISDGE